MSRAALAAAAFACVLAGCAALDAGGPSSPARDDDALRAAEAFARASRVATLAPAAQRRERDAAAAAWAREKSAPARLRLGLLLALPGTAIQDDARALALLDAGAAARVGDSAVADASRLFAAQLRERHRQVREEQRRTEASRQQLDALKAIERTLSERAEPGARH